MCVYIQCTHTPISLAFYLAMECLQMLCVGVALKMVIQLGICLLQQHCYCYYYCCCYNCAEATFLHRYPNVWSTSCCGWCPGGSGQGCPPNSTGAAWYPSGVDFTLQDGDHWFFTPGDGIHTLDELKDVYHRVCVQLMVREGGVAKLVCPV